MYLGDLAPHMQDLLDKELITAATLSFPLRGGDDISFHFTLHGVLASVGDNFSSKLITSWTEVPQLYDINTDDPIDPIAFADVDPAAYGGVQEFMRRAGVLTLEVATEHVGRIVKEHYTAQYRDVIVC